MSAATSGYGWGKIDSATTFSNPLSVPTTFSHASSANLADIMGGGQIGYNWQVAPQWVFGLEADWQVSGEKASQSSSDPFSFFIGIGTVNTNYEVKNPWFGTARSRIGYVWDGLLIYGTGGLAYGELKINGTSSESGIGIGGVFSGSSPFNGSKVNAGLDGWRRN